jgi:RNA polymerase sigma factor (sigma-70 family)
MDDRELLAQKFEENRSRLRPVAYRMLGSLAEADDALQEAWLRLNRSDASEIENLSGWLTTVVARVCLDMLRSRTHRREEPLAGQEPKPIPQLERPPDPEQEALLADSVGVALLVVLDRLAPAERLAFVLHDLFAVPFDEIASIVGRSATAARQLASRARRRVQGGGAVSRSELAGQRKVVDAFLAALRAGDFDALVSVLDPDMVFHTDQPGVPGGPMEVHGALTWARQAIVYAKALRFVEAALVDGMIGAVLAPRGRLTRAMTFTIVDGKITRVEVIAKPENLGKLELGVLES